MQHGMKVSRQGERQSGPFVQQCAMKRKKPSKIITSRVFRRYARPPYEQGETVKPIDESYLAWMKERKEPFTSEDAAKHFGVSRTTAAERLRLLTGLGYVTATKHPVRFNQLLYTYKQFSWHDPFNLAGKL